MICQRLGRLNFAAVGLAMCAFAGSATAQIVNQDLYYTRFTIAANDFNVKRSAVTYDKGTGALSFVLFNIAQVCGADGIVFASSSVGADLLIGGQFSANVNQVSTAGSWVGYRASGLTGAEGAFNVIRDPGGTIVWVTGEPGYPNTGAAGRLSNTQLLGISNPTAGIFPGCAASPGSAPTGVPHNIIGSDNNISYVVFTPSNGVFYTAENTVGDGGFNSFGTLPNIYAPVDITTVRLQGPGIEGFHSVIFDPWSGDLIAVGNNKMLQIDPANPTVIKSSFNFAGKPGVGLNFDMDQLAPDGKGLIYVASNGGELVVLNYTNSKLVGSPDNFAVKFMDTNLDDIAPVIGAPQNCCALGTGAFDLGNPQESQLTLFPSVSDRRTADDFYIQPNEVARLHSITATLITNVDTVNPGTAPFFYKAQLELYESCGCKPVGPPIKTITKTLSTPSKVGSVGGYDEIEFVFDLDNCVLKGGPTGTTYWVSVIGLGSQNASSGEQWFWGSAGHGTVQGCPGVFKSVSGGDTDWVGVETLCCGCRDFNFCIDAEICKVLLDNGTFKKTSFCGSESRARQNPAFDDIFTADQFVTPTCLTGVPLCYIEAYIISNCTKAGLKLWNNNCKEPYNVVQTTLTPDRIIDLGPAPAGAPGGFPNLHVRCLQFWTHLPSLNPGETYWLSAFGIFDGSLNQGAWFACNDDCSRPCLIRFFPASIKGRSFVTTGLTYDQWTPIGNDMAFLVAIDTASHLAAAGAPVANQSSGHAGPSPSVCAGDFNHDGQATVQDIFDFMSVFFAGCH